MANIEPPSFISGAASLAMRMKEWTETSIAKAKPSAEQSTSLPLMSSFLADAIEWTTIGALSAAGTSYSALNYHYVDEDPLQGTNYYRLHEVDQDGAEQFSEIVTAQFSSDRGPVIAPQPNNGHFMVQGIEQESPILLDGTGRQVPFRSGTGASSGALEVTWCDRLASCGELASRLPVRGIVFGHVILAVTDEDLGTIGPHERVHVAQYERWGPLFLLLYAASSLWQLINGRNPYWHNHFEVQARLKSR